MMSMDRPTVLLVGTGERMKAALEAALERHSMMVESVPVNRAVEAAFAAAPDLLVLIGDATVDGGRSVLAKLSASPATSTVPVVLLANEAGLDRRLDAFRHGVVAVVPKSASADGMARRIAEVAHELPERQGETAGELGEATVDELVELFSQQLRTGILSVTADGNDGASAQVVLRAGRPVAEAIEELVTRLRPLVSSAGAGALRYEFHESTSARLTLLDGDEGEPEDAALLEGRRILLIEQNPARADVLVQELRARGALVVVADGEGAGLERARAMDPEVVIIDGSGVHGWALASLRALRRDPRLRWASLLVVDAKDLWPAPDAGPDLERLASSLKPLVRADRELAERAAKEQVFDTRLEVVGPSRLVRALTETGIGLRLSIQHPRARVEVDLAEGIVAGALATRGGKTIAEGPGALATLLALGTGRVHVERKDAPASANVMAPLDDALAAAAREVAPIKPSIPPPSGKSEPPKLAAPARQQDADRLIGRLEELLERLQKVLPSEVKEEPRQRSIPKPAKAIPPPRRPLEGSRRKTLVLGSAKPAPPRYDSQDDLPVIEAVAEPGASAPTPAPEPPPAVIVEPAPAEPPNPQAPARPPSEQALPVVAKSTPSPSPIEQAPPAPPSTQSQDVVPHASGAAWERVESPAPPRSTIPAFEPEKPRSRGPLWFVLAFVVTLLLAGGAGAAYLYAGGHLASGGDAVQTLPATEVTRAEPARALSATEPPNAAAERDEPPAPAALPDAGPPDAGPPDAGPPDAGPPDAGPPDAGPDPGTIALAEESGDETIGDEEDADPQQTDPLTHAIRTGNFQRNRGNLQAAEASYMRALRIDRDNPRALAGLVRLNMARGNSSAAVRWARRLVAARPQNASNHVLLGDALQRSGNRRAATQSWQRALELSPGLRSARQRLGR